MWQRGSDQQYGNLSNGARKSVQSQRGCLESVIARSCKRRSNLAEREKPGQRLLRYARNDSSIPFSNRLEDGGL